MTCQETRSYISAYLDSELSSTTLHAISQHLEGCESCRDRFAAESEIEAALKERLSSLHPEEEALFDKAWTGAAQQLRTRRIQEVVGVAAPIAAILILGILLPWTHELDLAAEVAAHHARYLGNETELTLFTTDAGEVVQFFDSRFPFPINLNVSEESSTVIDGARLCFLKSAPTAMVALRVDQIPVTFFAFESQDLRKFPETGKRLREGNVHCSVGEYEFFARKQGNVALALVGEIAPEQLERVGTKIFAGEGSLK